MEGGARSREGGREPATALISATPPTPRAVRWLQTQKLRIEDERRGTVPKVRTPGGRNSVVDRNGVTVVE